jgi:RNA polymerase sigma factor (sigma-70 family)
MQNPYAIHSFPSRSAQNFTHTTPRRPQKKESAEILRQCIDALPISQAQIIDLVYYHGKSVSEIAEIMQIAEGTVKTRMFYARKRLASMTLIRSAAPYAQARR